MSYLIKLSVSSKPYYKFEYFGQKNTQTWTYRIKRTLYLEGSGNRFEVEERGGQFLAGKMWRVGQIRRVEVRI